MKNCCRQPRIYKHKSARRLAAWWAGGLVGWLVGWLVGLLASCHIMALARCLAGLLAVWLVRLVGEVASWLVS